jgi:hypothetical protein
VLADAVYALWLRDKALAETTSLVGAKSGNEPAPRRTASRKEVHE